MKNKTLIKIKKIFCFEINYEKYKLIYKKNNSFEWVSLYYKSLFFGGHQFSATPEDFVKVMSKMIEPIQSINKEEM